MSLEKANIDRFDTRSEPRLVGDRWKKWLRSFEYFVLGEGITGTDRKRAMLLHLAGPEVQDIFEILPKRRDSEPVDQIDDYALLVSRLNAYFLPKKNKIFERHIFRGLHQSENEGMDQFYARLKSQAEFCDFKDQENNMIIDQIVEKCLSSSLRVKILEKGDDVTLTQVLELARSLEVMSFQTKSFSSSNSEINRMKLLNKTEMKIPYQQAKSPHLPRCFRCNRLGHLANDPSCPAKKAKCKRCDLVGHFSACCKKPKVNAVKESISKEVDDDYGLIQNDPEEAADYAFMLGEKFATDSLASCKVGGVPITLLVDSGSSLNIVDQRTWDKLKKERIKCSSWRCVESVQPYGSQPIPIIGKFRACIEHKNKNVSVDFSVTSAPGRPILGLRSSQELGLLQLHLNTLDTIRFQEDFPGLFDGIGKLKDAPLKLFIDSSITPVAQKARPVPVALRSKVQDAVSELEKHDIIERVNTPTSWASPIVPIHKADGSLRICVDMRQANQAIKRQRQPLPTAEEMFENFEGASFFSKLDMNWGFHQIELCEESRDITTFVTQDGIFRYKRLSFGVSSAPECFHAIVRDLLKDCSGAINFMDDIVVYGSTKEEHDERLRKVLRTFWENGLTLNKSKCEIGTREINFMGLKISQKGCNVTESKVAAISAASAPKNVSELRSFLGLVQFCSKFIKNLSTVAEPLNNLLRKESTYKWSIEQEDSFLAIKDALSKPENLSFFKSNAETILTVDASPFGLGAVLSQKQNGVERIISYGSRTLSNVERRYAQTEREGLAIVWACEYFQRYLFGTRFEIRTDHKPLVHIFSVRSKPSARIERWILRLQPYDFFVKYIPGPLNFSDSLSRLSVNRTTIAHKPDPVDLVYSIVQSSVPSNLSAREIEIESAKDFELHLVREAIKTGNWSAKDLPVSYKALRTEFAYLGQMVLRGTRIVIPESLRQKVINLAHVGHQGIVKTKALLRTKVWWPGMDEATEKVIKRCRSCALVTPIVEKPPMSRTSFPNAPWSYVAIDLLGPIFGATYLLVVTDFYSRWFEVREMKHNCTTTKDVIKCLDSIWAIFGIPETIKADNGPQFTSSEFCEYLKGLSISLVHSTPLWPQSNGEVERQNRTILKTLKISCINKTDWRQDLDHFLLANRSTPHSSTSFPPFQLMFGRIPRNRLPGLSSHSFDEEVRDKDACNKEKQLISYNSQNNVKPSEITVNDTILLRNEGRSKLEPYYRPEEFKVINDQGSQAVVENENGSKLCRNKSFMKKVSSAQDDGLNLSTSDPPETVDPTPDCAPQIFPEEVLHGTTHPRTSRDRRPPKWLSDYAP